MTNHEIRMTKETRNPNDTTAGGGLPHGTTDHRPLTTNHERFQIRLPPIAEEPRLHGRGRAHARAGHRGEHGHLYRRQCRLAESAALSRARACRDDLDGQLSDESRLSRTAAHAAG